MRRFWWVCSQNACKVEMDEATSPRRCAGKECYITISSPWYHGLVGFPDWDARKGQRLSVRQGSGLGGWQSASTTRLPQDEHFDYTYLSRYLPGREQGTRADQLRRRALLCSWDTTAPTRCTDSSPTLPAFLTALDTVCSGRIDCPLPLPPSCRPP